MSRRAAGIAVAAAAAGHVLAVLLVRNRGASAADRARPLPGDELVPRPLARATRAVAVGAPAAEVWPWLAQIGQDRAGFYSLRRLENLVGCRMPDTDRIHPEWQHRDVGEPLPIHPRRALAVRRFEPGEAIAVEHWGTLAVVPDGGDRCRVLMRNRVPRSPLGLAYLLFEVPHAVMELAMLRGIRRRAEAGRAADA
ncbi:MAG: SRPBCC family protein [Thermoleophilia bacterium]